MFRPEKPYWYGTIASDTQYDYHSMIPNVRYGYTFKMYYQSRYGEITVSINGEVIECIAQDAINMFNRERETRERQRQYEMWYSEHEQEIKEMRDREFQEKLSKKSSDQTYIDEYNDDELLGYETLRKLIEQSKES
jgi:hypothetical protein